MHPPVDRVHARVLQGDVVLRVCTGVMRLVSDWL